MIVRAHTIRPRHFTGASQISKSTKSVKVQRPIYFVRTVQCGYLADWGRNPQANDNADLAGSCTSSSDPAATSERICGHVARLGSWYALHNPQRNHLSNIIRSYIKHKGLL